MAWDLGDVLVPELFRQKGSGKRQDIVVGIEKRG